LLFVLLERELDRELELDRDFDENGEMRLMIGEMRLIKSIIKYILYLDIS